MWWQELTPEQISNVYQEVFGLGSGPQVLEHLVALFHDRRIYQSGGLEGQRETERRAAQKEVIEHILRLTAQGIGGQDEA